MHGELYDFFANDHDRLEDLFLRATRDPRAVDMALYREFRAGLLKHISMEEKVLLPAAQAAHGGEPLPMAERIRLDHGAIAALLVPIPSPLILKALRAILSKHNELEEAAEGMYEICEEMPKDQMSALLQKLRSMPDVPMNPLMDPERVPEATRRALTRAGYDLDAYSDEKNRHGRREYFHHES